MAWEKTITTKGINLQAKILAGAPVIITRVAVGGSFVPSDQLASSDDVADYLSNVIVDVNPPDHILDRATIKIVVTNGGITTITDYFQLGVFAEDPDDGEILYLIAQDPTGNQIPATSEVAEFQAKYEFEILVSPTSDITVVYGPESHVTHEQLEADLEIINTKLGNKSPTFHKTPGEEFGIGDESEYGHLKADMDGTQSFSVQRKYITGASLNLSDYTNNNAQAGIYEFNGVTAFTNAPPDTSIPNPASGYITVHKNTDRTITLGAELHIHGYSTIWLWGGGQWSKVEDTAALAAAAGAQETADGTAADIREQYAGKAVTDVTAAYYGADGTYRLTLRKTPDGEGETPQTQSVLPLASSSAHGVMPREAYAQIGENTADLGALKGRALRYPAHLGTQAPADAQLEAAVTALGGTKTDGATVVDLDYEKEYTWYAADGSWRDRGQTTLTLATSAAAGMVRGTDGTGGKILVEMDGTMSLVGYDALVSAQTAAASGIATLGDKLATLTQDISAVRKVSSLPSDASSHPDTLYLVTG